MAPEWAKLCRGDRDFEVDGDAGAIEVRLAEGRRHRVKVRDGREAYELRAVVVGAAKAREIGGPDCELALRAWRWNRGAQLVGFRVDERGRLVGEAWVPKAGLTGEEWRGWVRRVAGECDRVEFLMTGEDAE